MAPKIRGISTTTKRHAKPDLEVSPKKLMKLGNSAKTLMKGDIVEVRFDEEGLYGSWHKAVICGVKQGLRLVKFENLLDDRKNPMKEWLAFGKESLNIKLPSGAREKTDKPVIRPGGPGFPPREPSFRKTGGWPKDLWVECFSEDAWWEGVLIQDISAEQLTEKESVVEVIFPQLGDLIEQVAVKNLRECKDWNEDTGVWTIRGRRAQDDSDAAVPAKPVFEKANIDRIGEGEKQAETRPQETNEDTSLPENTSLVPYSRISPMQSRTQSSFRPFGRLLGEMVEESRYLLRIDTLGYSLAEFQVSIKDGFLLLKLAYDMTEDKQGIFTCQLKSVSTSSLALPVDRAGNDERISWQLDGEVLIVTVPRGI